jgi:hypothetical protein
MLPNFSLLALLLLAHSISTRGQSLPTVDLGYEIHQALYYDVSRLFPKQVLANITLSL